MPFINVDFGFTEFVFEEDAAITAVVASAVRNAKSDRYARLAYNALLKLYNNEGYSGPSIWRALSKQHQIVWC